MSKVSIKMQRYFFQVEMNTENKWEAVDNVQVKNKKSAILKIQGNEYLNIINFILNMVISRYISKKVGISFS